jgi:hypothetical protein
VLREGDYLTELGDDCNRMLDALQRRGVAVPKPADPAQDDDAQRRMHDNPARGDRPATARVADREGNGETGRPVGRLRLRFPVNQFI